MARRTSRGASGPGGDESDGDDASPVTTPPPVGQTGGAQAGLSSHLSLLSQRRGVLAPPAALSLYRAFLPEQDAAVEDKLRRRGANLCRTMVEAGEALARCQGKGEHHRHAVRVEHVTVQAGRQAIVGAVAAPAPPPRASAARCWHPARLCRACWRN